MRRREPLVIGSVVAWVGVFWFGLGAFMMGWGPDDVWTGKPAIGAPSRRATAPSGPLGDAALRRALDS